MFKKTQYSQFLLTQKYTIHLLAVNLGHSEGQLNRYEYIYMLSPWDHGVVHSPDGTPKLS